MSLHHRFLLSLLMLVSAATTALALPPALPNGDYYSNEAPVKGTAPRSLMPGSLWRVTATHLNCHAAPGADQPIVRSLQQGDEFQVEVFRGGSDEVLLNAKDAAGKPWMPVRGQSFVDRCYVRANQRYIQPVAPR